MGTGWGFVGGAGHHGAQRIFLLPLLSPKSKKVSATRAFSLGAHNTEEDITHAVSILKTILNNI